MGLDGAEADVQLPGDLGVGPTARDGGENLLLPIGERVVVAVATATTLVLGLVAIRRRHLAEHRAWMTRGYAIAMGAGTQFFVQAGWLASVGPLTVSSKTGTMAAAWLINVVVAEWIIRHRPARTIRHPARVVSVVPAG